MISEYLMKGIDSLFSKGMGNGDSNNTTKVFSKDIIKSNLQFVVKEAARPGKINQQNEGDAGGLNKSRLRMILQKNKDAQIKSVIRRDNSRSPSPYQRISPAPRTCTLLDSTGDRITYYREQRKTIEKSRVLQKSRIGGSQSRIFRVSSQLRVSEQVPSKTDILALASHKNMMLS